MRTKSTDALMLFFIKRHFPDGASTKAIADFEKRPLECTPFSGNYGELAGWVICVNGSPPKGTLVVFESGKAFDLCGSGRKVAAQKDLKTIDWFVKETLTGKTKPFTIK